VLKPVERPVPRPGPGELLIKVEAAGVNRPDIQQRLGAYPPPKGHSALPGLEIDGARVITSEQALELDHVPSSVVVLGGGVIGVEFASVWKSFGAEVTVVEALPNLVPLEDPAISKQLERAFRKRGIAAHAGASVTGVSDTGDHVEVAFEAGGAEQTVTVDVCLVAVGRGPVTDDLGLEEAGVELDRGFVKVDGQLQTTAAHVWAIGDVAATPLQLAHVSFTEGYAVAERIAGVTVPEIDYTQIPRVTYCSPEIASVGITEAQAIERGHDVEVERFNFQGVGKANIVGEGGLVKIVAAKEGPVLGVHMVGPHVTDLISESMLAVAWEAVPAEVAALIHPHPTLSEGVGEAFLALAGKPLHGA